MLIAVTAIVPVDGAGAKDRGSTCTRIESVDAARSGTGSWTELPPGPITGRTFPSTVWTDHELVVWGGEAGSEAELRADGAAFDPVAQTWRTIAAAPISARSEHVAVWTGIEMIVWGGFGPKGDASDAGAYNPTTDRWRVLPKSPVPSANFATAVWTGTEVIVWGGVRNGGTRPAAGGAAYDPQHDRWRRIRSGPLTTRAAAAAVWTGCEMVIWGGRSATGYEDDGASYDPRTNRWRRMPAAPFPTQWEAGESVTVLGGHDVPLRMFVHPNLVWTGVEAIVWGFLYNNGVGDTQVAPTAAFDPVHNRWRALSPAPIDFAPQWDGSGGDRAVWTGDAMLVWTGNIDRRGVRALVYDPSIDTWTELAPPPGKPDRYFLDLVATSDAVIVWGPDPPLLFPIGAHAP